jgi:hypothetical protein
MEHAPWPGTRHSGTAIFKNALRRPSPVLRAAEKASFRAVFRDALCRDETPNP